MSTSTTPSPQQSVPCSHCGLPAPPPRGEAQESFCCNGCKGAYELIRGWGFDQFYDLRGDDQGVTPLANEEARFADLDHPELLGKSAPRAVTTSDGDELLVSELSIAGIHCAACLWLLENAPQRVDGWQAARVQMHKKTLTVTYDPQVIQLSKVATVLATLGYQLSPINKSDTASAIDQESRQLLVSIAIAGFCAANAMWLAIALYAGEFTGIEDSHAMIFRVGGVLLGCVAVFFPGRVFFQSARAALVTKTPHMDLPVAIGLTAGVLGSLYGLFDLEKEVYFDSIAALVFFLLVGRWLQNRQQRKAGEEIASLLQIAPMAATRVNENGAGERVPVDQLVVGDLIVVAAGESLPVDGVVESGSSELNCALLTGESRPVAKQVGDHVESGTENITSELKVRATAVGDETRFAQLQDAVSCAASERTPVVQLANRIGGWFVGMVILLAIATAVGWFFIDAERVVPQTVSLLIVACPCALALATPLAVAIAIGRLANVHVLVREGGTLERVNSVGTIFFDKTGTLTSGSMKVDRVVGELSVEELSLIWAVEQRVKHPIAKALVEYAKSQLGAEVLDSQARLDSTVNSVSQLPGRGVVAELSGDRQLEIGAPRLLLPIESSWSFEAESIAGSGLTPIAVLIDGEVRALLGLNDEVRADAKNTVGRLKEAGWVVGILSGDQQKTVTCVARELGIATEQSRGQLLPEEKLQAIHAVEHDGPVLMVGDGLNDAAALAAADVGIAIRGGAASSLSAAPVIISDGQLRRVTDFIRCCRITRQTIVMNFVISIGYNLIAVSLAITGLITPLLAAILMPVSSLTVILMTLSSSFVKEDESVIEHEATGSRDSDEFGHEIPERKALVLGK